MATVPYFVFSPNTLLSLIGWLHGPDKTEPTPSEDWSKATVDVVIPALNEEENIVACLASLAKQTLKPRRVILVDDGSRDHTLELARAFCLEMGIELIGIHRAKPIGKTPTLKRQAREFDSDVEFILDGDTVLESENYLERCVAHLFEGKGVASVCGTVLPLREKDRRRLLAEKEIGGFLASHPLAPRAPRPSWPRRLDRAITNIYREALYLFLQRFVYHGEMLFFGTISNPVGCAVAYRRDRLRELFDHYEPILGDDLSNSEDIFLGFALLEEGYRNVHLREIVARSNEPPAHRLPHQLYLWSSAFLQSCYYFDNLLRSPFKAWRRHRHQKQSAAAFADRRKVQEPYRQAFGRAATETWGRPIGWVLLLSAIEKISFPSILLIFIILRMWTPLGITLLAETVVSLTLLTLVAKDHRWEYLGKGILITPLRYASLFFDLWTIGRFASDLWIRRDRRWRK